MTRHGGERPGEPPSGLLLLDKPAGCTSHGVVQEVRRLLKTNKVGHCGTLDPFATGVFIICLNHATRISDQLLEQDKGYHFVVRFGCTSDTLDGTGSILQTYDGPPIPRTEVEAALKAFHGKHYLQEVPRYSAVRVQGQRLYALTRKGVEVDPPRRRVFVQSLTMTRFRWPLAELQLHCSKGTYVRQLAADIGTALQCGAYVTALRRTVSGVFGLDRTLSMEAFRRLVAEGTWQERLVSLTEALAHLPSVVLSDPKTIEQLTTGHLGPDVASACRAVSGGTQLKPVRLLEARTGNLLALWMPQADGLKRQRMRVFTCKHQQQETVTS